MSRDADTGAPEEAGMDGETDRGGALGAVTEIVLPAATGGGNPLGGDPLGGGGNPLGGGVRGTVRIAPAVLIELIELTVRDVPGVAGVHPRRRVERILPRGPHGAGGDGRHAEGVHEAGGVRVRVRGDRIDADVSIVIAPDVDIRALSETIQRKVGVAAGRMLGMTVTEVNVYVADVESGSAPGDKG